MQLPCTWYCLHQLYLLFHTSVSRVATAASFHGQWKTGNYRPRDFVGVKVRSSGDFHSTRIVTTTVYGHALVCIVKIMNGAQRMVI